MTTKLTAVQPSVLAHALHCHDSLGIDDLLGPEAGRPTWHLELGHELLVAGAILAALAVVCWLSLMLIGGV